MYCLSCFQPPDMHRRTEFFSVLKYVVNIVSVFILTFVKKSDGKLNNIINEKNKLI